MKVTRILHAKRPHQGKVAALREQARRLGSARSEVWQRLGSIGGVGLSDRQIRDGWLKEGRTFPVSANAWKETLRDAKGDIAACMEAAKVKARRCIWRHTQDKTEQQRLFTALKRNEWTHDSYLRRIMRRIMRRDWVRGHNRTHNQIIVRADNDTAFQIGGRAWIKIPGHARIRDVVFQSVHRVIDKAAVIAAEDLTAPMAGKSFGKNIHRRLAACERCHCRSA